MPETFFSLTGHSLLWALARDAHIPAFLANRRQWPSSGKREKCQEGCHPLCSRCRHATYAIAGKSPLNWAPMPLT